MKTPLEKEPPARGSCLQHGIALEPGGQLRVILAEFPSHQKLNVSVDVINLRVDRIKARIHLVSE